MGKNQPRVVIGRYTKLSQEVTKETTTSDESYAEVAGISFTYQTCRCVCANSNFPPSAQLSYSVGTPESTGNGAWVVPIYATGSVTYPTNSGCGCTPPEAFRGVVYYEVLSDGACAPCVIVDSSESKVVAEPYNVNCKGLTSSLYIASSIVVNVE